MKKIIILILLLNGLIIQAIAQEALTKKEIADILFERYEYFKSLNIYLVLAERNNPKLQVVERVADCYRLMNNYENAEIWYKKAITYPKASLIDTYYYAETLLHNKNIKEAREQFKLYYDKTSNTTKLKFKQATCDSAEKWMQSPTNAFTIKNEQKYNSKYSDWGLNYYGKTEFVFTSDRKVSDKQKDTYSRNGDGYFNLYYSSGEQVIPFLLKTKDNPLFAANYHIGPIAFNTAGDTAYITITTTVPKDQLAIDKRTKGNTQQLYTRRLQLIIATKTNDQWNNFKSFQYNNIKEYSIGHATLSKNGNIIYFTSDMPGGEGKTDIWYCEKLANGTWDKPVNCGNLINTDEDEAFPTISGDGALYYSSTGLPGMGGYDIYKVKGERSKWSKPENLKYPVNSTSDDFSYITRDSLSGYFSSNRDGGTGNDDIYSFSYDSSYKRPLNISAASSKNTAPLVAITKPPVLTSTSVLKKGEKFIVNNIYYDVNKADVRPDAAVELDKLVLILKQHPSLRIEVSAHTDSRSASSYNMALSNRRAAATVAYLVKHGIVPNRLVAKGYGDTHLLNKCAKGEYCTEAEHQINRRTEIRVLSNDE
ncbi:OmpA family protein [Mucilaginibacter sp.]|uniref:OmpA family protein n=1 Tax=Mucilaginibacter sp. TaxID=1882438 RepID=UPI002611D082|nr:OmpA family protein [Mucilaginibacter sp.]MDB5031161.1 pal [Mucilaginibacter sp.]